MTTTMAKLRREFEFLVAGVVMPQMNGIEAAIETPRDSSQNVEVLLGLRGQRS